VAGLVLVVLVALLVGRGGPTPEAALSDDPVQGRPFPPGTVRIVDEAAGISYPYLGQGWFEWDLGPVPETSAVAGQYLVAQEDLPTGQSNVAQCTSGPLRDEFGYAGPDSLRSAVMLVADDFPHAFPAPSEMRVRRDEPRTVDGSPAHLYEFDLSFDAPGWDAGGERTALLLVDVGRPAPALLTLSIPNTHAEHYGVIDRVLSDVEVL
jgi:hypothetical protein